VQRGSVGWRSRSHLADGGQKRVFRATIATAAYAVKFMRPTVQQVATAEVAEDVSVVDDVTARAAREVETMRQCETPHLVKPGPIGLTAAEVSGERLLYFTEEFIEGDNLRTHLEDTGPMSVRELARLATEMTLAIQELWSFRKIHRDVKPTNIMRRRDTGEFVLLDMGLVFDLDDRSFSLGPVGTLAYFSPEQTDFRNRRTVLDFRSDTFSLGIVLYLMATGQHPFTQGASNTWEVLNNIQTLVPVRPKQIRADLPDELDGIIVRLLGKRPALRYRTPQRLLGAIKEVSV
jgi:serine/threonine protein kinase